MALWINGPLMLGKDPEQKQSSSGTTFCKGFGFLETNDQSIPCGIVAFSDSLQTELMKYRKGQPILVSGEFSRQEYIKNGENKESFNLVLRSIAGIKRQTAVQDEVKPRKQPTPIAMAHSPTEAARNAPQTPNAYENLGPAGVDGFEDDLPF